MRILIILLMLFGFSASGQIVLKGWNTGTNAPATVTNPLTNPITSNLQTNGFWISNDGGNECIFPLSTGGVGFGTSTLTSGYLYDFNGATISRGTFRFEGAIRDNRDNGLINQSATGVTSNRDLTFGNGAYGRFMFTAKNFIFGTGTPSYPALGVYSFWHDAGTNTGSGAGSGIYFKPMTAQQSSGGTTGGDFQIYMAKGFSTNRSGYFTIKDTASSPATILNINSGGTFELNKYGSGNKEAADLSKTESIYHPVYATDGTVIERRMNYGTVSGTPDGSGDLSVTHGLGITPTIVLLGPNTVANYTYYWHTADGTTFKIRVTDAAAGTAVTAGTVSISWEAK